MASNHIVSPATTTIQMQALAKLPAVQDAMERYFLEHKDQAAVGLELLPGVRELLTELKVP